MVRYLFSFIFALVLCVSVWAQAPSAEEPPDVTAKVLDVIDGDTFAIRDPVTNRRRQVSLPALDAPELAQARGKEAKKSLEKLINGREVTISYVVRSKRPVIAKITANGVDVGLEQLKAGWAWFMRGKPFKDGDEDRRRYGAAETEAKAAKRGLWQDADPLTPAKYRKQAKEAAFGPPPPLDEQVVGNKTTRKYHMPHCAGYKGVALENRVLFATATDAEKEGYTLAGNCRTTPKPKPKPVAAPVATTDTPVAIGPPATATTALPVADDKPAPYVGNKNSKIYHQRGCPGYKRVTPLNAVNFPTAEAAEAAGYRRAKNCN